MAEQVTHYIAGKVVFSKIITYTEKQNLPEDWGSLEAYISHLSEIMAQSMNVNTEFPYQKVTVTLSEEQQVALEFGSLAHQNERPWWVNLGQARPQDFSSRTSLATAVPLYVCPMPFFSGI